MYKGGGDQLSSTISEPRPNFPSWPQPAIGARGHSGVALRDRNVDLWTLLFIRSRTTVVACARGLISSAGQCGFRCLDHLSSVPSAPAGSFRRDTAPGSGAAVP